MNPLVGFVFLFLTIQNIFTIIEWPWYLGEVVSDIEGGRTKMTRNGLLSFNFLKAAINYMLFYVFALLSFYYFILRKNENLMSAFLLGCTINAVTDTAMHAMFSRASINHIPVLLYDVFVVGGIAYALCLYTWQNYKAVLSNYWFGFALSFIFTSALYIYVVNTIENSPYKKAL